MTLRTRARLLALISVLVFLTLLGVFLIADREKAQAERDLALAESLIFQTIQLRTALFDFLLRPQTQPRSQAEGQFDLLQDLLKEQAGAIERAIRNDSQTRYAWDGVHRLIGEMQALFAELGHGRGDPRFAERDQRTVDLILVDGHSLILFVSQLRHRAGSGFVQATARENLALGLLLAGLAGLGLGLFLAFERAVLSPVHRIHAAVVRVTNGETDLRIGSPRKDELGELADGFDRMLDQLQKTMVSRDRLEAEVAERMQTEAALRASEAALKDAQRLAGLGRWSWDIRTDAHTWSEEIYRFYGRDPALPPAVYPEVQTYFTPASWARLGAVVQRALTEGIAYECEAEIVRPDGTHGWIVARGEAARGTDGQIARLSGTVQDITARKLAEKEIQALNSELERRVEQRTAELKTANRELESFAYAVSHDLRAPLRALSGFSQALAEDYADRLDSEARAYLDQIDLASRRMGELIDGILTLSRITRGELRREPVDLSALADRLHAECAAAEPERQLAWEVEPGLAVHGDPAMLEAALRNLIENAWKYTGKTPQASVRVYAEDRPGEVATVRWICVSDNGAGFDMAYSERLFQPFQRLHRQDEFPGIGIGLATVQRIVHRHGGIIEAQGAPGRGATFRFTLPDLG